MYVSIYEELNLGNYFSNLGRLKFKEPASKPGHLSWDQTSNLYQKLFFCGTNRSILIGELIFVADVSTLFRNWESTVIFFKSSNKPGVKSMLGGKSSYE